MRRRPPWLGVLVGAPLLLGAADAPGDLVPCEGAGIVDEVQATEHRERQSELGAALEHRDAVTLVMPVGHVEHDRPGVVIEL